MTRYFYTDSLAASWMAKHFGMRFQNGLGINVHWNQGMSGRSWFTPHDAQHIQYYGNFHIHPDSLRLLEPHVGDYARDNFVLIEVVADDEAGDGPLFSVSEAKALMSRYQKHRVFEIIQRSGVAFMWPESEGV